MAGLSRRKLELRIGTQRPPELIAAGALALCRAVDESEVLVRIGAFGVVQSELDRGLQAPGRIRILAIIVLTQAHPERAATIAKLKDFAQLIAQIAHGLRAAPRQCHEQPDGDQGACSHRKRCRILTASPAFNCTRSTCAGKVELRISTVW